MKEKLKQLKTEIDKKEFNIKNFIKKKKILFYILIFFFFFFNFEIYFPFYLKFLFFFLTLKFS
jgi:hypothetical protein